MVSGNTVTYTGAGSCVIDANQAGNASYDAAPQVAKTAPVGDGTPTNPGVTNPTITAAINAHHHKRHHHWYRFPVTVNFTCTVGSAPLTGPCPSPVTLRHNGKGQTVTRSITAGDGGSATVTVGPINIDRAKPHVHVKGAKNGHVYHHGRHLTCVAKDKLSGLASCKIHKHHHTHHGIKRVNWKAVAKDLAGNVRKVHGHYFVKHRR